MLKEGIVSWFNASVLDKAWNQDAAPYYAASLALTHSPTHNIDASAISEHAHTEHVGVQITRGLLNAPYWILNIV